MEEDNLPPPDSVTNSTNTTTSTAATPTVLQSEEVDRSLQLKHAAMLERLANLHQSRLVQKSDSASPSDGSAKSFLTRFNQSKSSIESHLSKISNSSAPICSSDANDSEKSELEKVASSISNLEKHVAENSFLLPSYEIRSCLKAISDLRQSLDNVTSQVVPKRKFSFKNKKKSSLANSLQNDILIGAESKNLGEKKSFFEDINVALNGVSDSSPGFRGLNGEILVREFSREAEEGEFSLSGLMGCQVKLKGCLRSLFVNKLRDCRVYVGAVFGSVLIEDVEGCVFVLASHQIRIHSAKQCDFYLRVRSRPIIEDCSGVRFAPYCLRYNGIEKDLAEANLSDETGNWAKVDDFRWLRAVQSPNWIVLPENECVDTVDISS